MGLSLSRESKFYELKSNVGSLLQTIESAGKDAGQVASDCSSSLAELPFGSWDDDISTTLKNYCLSVKAGMDEVVNDISGGSFVSLKAAISDLITGLGQCEKYKNNYNYQNDRLRTVSNEEKRQKIKELAAAEGRNLDNCISYCNNIVNAIEAIQFNGVVPYKLSGGAAGLEDTDSLYEASLIDTDPPESTPAPETPEPKSTPITMDFVKSITNKGSIVYDSNGKKYTVYNDGYTELTMVDEGGQISSITPLDLYSSGQFFTHE